MTVDAAFAEIDWRGRRVRIEYRWVGVDRPAAPLLVFLHEGLGSLAMWRDFPHRLCAAGGYRGLVYSRPGYGRSTPRAPDDAWGLDFMHRQAHEVLPALLAALGVDAATGAPWLFGHSDGGSIALLYASRFPERLAGAIVLAPHIVVEDRTIAGIQQARTAFREAGLRERLARFHDDPDATFRSWNDAWLHPPFRHWTIEPELDAITCPVLAIQGEDDEYGTLEQIRGIARRVPGAALIELPRCGHAPHLGAPQPVIEATQAFIETHRRGDQR